MLIPIGRNGSSAGRIGTRVQQMPQFKVVGEHEMPVGVIAPAQLYAPMARRHMELFGTTSSQLGEIAVVYPSQRNSQWPWDDDEAADP